MFRNTVNHVKFHLKPTALTYRFNFGASNALLNQGALSSESTKNSSRKSNSTFQLNRGKIQGRIFFFSFSSFRFTSLCHGPGKLAPPSPQITHNLKLIMTWSHAFSRAFTLSSHWLIAISTIVLIGRCVFFGFGFTRHNVNGRTLVAIISSLFTEF